MQPRHGRVDVDLERVVRDGQGGKHMAQGRAGGRAGAWGGAGCRMELGVVSESLTLSRPISARPRAGI